MALTSSRPKRANASRTSAPAAGYYTAILSELVGAQGHITAIEYDAILAERAKENLADRKNVEVVQGNGCKWPKEETDIIYVNFAIPRPAAPWIENLSEGGRLIFPPWRSAHDASAARHSTQLPSL